MLWFNLLGALVVYAIQRAQQWLPLNPQAMAAVSPDSAFNTAASFATNTNWQGYGGESTMSYLTQMLALAVQNFVSAATGMAVLVALIRGFARKEASGIGNFWADLVRTTRLHPAAAVDRAVARAGKPGRAADVRQVRDGDARPAGDLRQSEERPGRPAAQGREGQSGHREGDRDRADDSAGPGGVADRHQAARHQRRRLLQRQFGAPVRESDAARELSGDAVDPADRRGALLHVRQDDRRHAPGLGAARRDDAHLRPAPRRRLRRRGRRATRSLPGSARIRSQPRPIPAATWKARKCASASPTPRCGRSPRPRRRTARSTRCTIRSCRSPGWSRCG